VIALGYDQVEMEQRVREYVNRHGLNVNVVRVGKFENDDMNSSSKIRKKILEKFAR
jgi:glycerol-3-phosphate cytidylyltransferase-like family protein